MSSWRSPALVARDIDQLPERVLPHRVHSHPRRVGEVVRSQS